MSGPINNNTGQNSPPPQLSFGGKVSYGFTLFKASWVCVEKAGSTARHVMSGLMTFIGPINELGISILGLKCLFGFSVVNAITDIPSQTKEIKASLKVGDTEGVALNGLLLLVLVVDTVGDALNVTKAVLDLAKIVVDFVSPLFDIVPSVITIFVLVGATAVAAVKAYRKDIMIKKLDETLKADPSTPIEATAKKIHDFSKDYFELTAAEKTEVEAQKSDADKAKLKEKIVQKKVIVLTRHSNAAFASALKRSSEIEAGSLTPEAVKQFRELRGELKRGYRIELWHIASHIAGLAAISMLFASSMMMTSFPIPVLPFILLAIYTVMKCAAGAEHIYYHYYRKKNPVTGN